MPSKSVAVVAMESEGDVVDLIEAGDEHFNAFLVAISIPLIAIISLCVNPHPREALDP